MADISGDVEQKSPVILDGILGSDIETIWMIREHLVDETAVFAGFWNGRLDGSQHMILPDFPQCHVREIVYVNPVSIVIEASASDHAVEMDIEFEVFAKSVQHSDYAWQDFDVIEESLEDATDGGKNLFGGYAD